MLADAGDYIFQRGAPQMIIVQCGDECRSSQGGRAAMNLTREKSKAAKSGKLISLALAVSAN